MPSGKRVRLSSPSGRSDHPVQPPGRRSARAGSRAPVRRGPGDVVGGRHVLCRVRHSPGRPQQHAAGHSLAIGVAFLGGFFLFIRSRERRGKEPLLPTGLFRNRTSNLGLITQNLQWLLLLGGVVCRLGFPDDRTALQRVPSGGDLHCRHLRHPGLVAAERLAKRYLQKTLIAAGFGVTVAGIGLLLGLVKVASSSAWAFAPGSY